MEELHNLRNEALALINEAKDKKEIENLRIAFLGRQGKINNAFSKLKDLPKNDKASFGALINDVKKSIETSLQGQLAALNQEIDEQFFDPTLPGLTLNQGHLHPITQAIEEIQRIFEKIGFIRVSFPEVDWDWYVFESLNMPSNHPARDEWETIFIDEKTHPKMGNLVLTTHTSNGQVREMERVKTPPIRMLNIGKCYRRQQDPTHTVMFHQFEGLVVDKGIGIPHLKATLDYFGKEFFGPQIKSRIRPFHFRFTEPLFEVDFTCTNCQGKGCRFCKSGWVEVGGAGMVHPNVLVNGGIDAQKYTGFAFGWGVERVLRLKPGLNIADIRILYNHDLRFLEQF